MRKIIVSLLSIIFLASGSSVLAATPCRSTNNCPVGFSCVYLNDSASEAVCARNYQDVIGEAIIKPAKEGEFCGAGPKGVVECETGLVCDESRNVLHGSGEVVGTAVGAGGICVKATSPKPTIVDNCRFKKCGDANCDGVINSLDVILWKEESAGGGGAYRADFNNDNKVDDKDYALLVKGMQGICNLLIEPSKLAKEGEFCGAGPKGVVECETGLVCDESRNVLHGSGEVVGTAVGAGGICVKATSKLAKEGEFCGAGPKGVVECETGLVCDESRNVLHGSGEVVGTAVGAGGICVKATSPKPTIVDNCRFKKCGDANCDGKMDTADRVVWLKERFTKSRNADFNADGKIDLKDYSVLVDGIRNGCKVDVTPKITLTPTGNLRYVAPTIKPLISCSSDSDCSKSEECYQPPTPTCSPGVFCIQSLMPKYCRTKGVQLCDRCSKVFDYMRTQWEASDCSVDPKSNVEVIRTYDASCKAPTATRDPNQCSRCSKINDQEYTWWSKLERKTCDVDPTSDQTIYRAYNKDCQKMSAFEITGVVTIANCRASNGDANNDGKVNLTDYSVWRAEYAKGKVGKADFNCDKKVDMTDYKIWKEVFLRTKNLMVSSAN